MAHQEYPVTRGLIEHLGRRVIGIYEVFLDWAADIRRIAVPEELQRACELAARAMDRPLEDMRQFVARCVSEVERSPNLAPGPDGQPVIIEIVLGVSLDERLMAEYRKEMKRAERKLRRR